MYLRGQTVELSPHGRLAGSFTATALRDLLLVRVRDSQAAEFAPVRRQFRFVVRLAALIFVLRCGAVGIEVFNSHGVIDSEGRVHTQSPTEALCFRRGQLLALIQGVPVPAAAQLVASATLVESRVA